jgi:3-hydroxyacyl-CoA dehydrogenase / enoyl-CoA hydratase / 3-hydroxybutyryl-CoA epimerase
VYRPRNGGRIDLGDGVKKIGFVDFPKLPNGPFLSALEKTLIDPSNAAICIRFPVTKDEEPDELHLLCSAPPILSGLRQRLRAMEKGPKPVAAWLAGNISGLAFEVALACHRRFAHRNETRFHWPWIKFGLPPALGTTQRLPYLVGLKSALDCLLFGKSIGDNNATDELLFSPSNGPAEEVLPGWVECLEKPVQPWDQNDITRSPLWSQTVTNRALLQSAYLQVRQKSPPEDVAPGLLLQVFHDGLERTFDAGLKLETDALERARIAPSTKQRIYVQYELPRQATKRATETSITFQKIGVLGSGLMGTGIAYTAAAAGFDIRLFDVSAEAINRSLNRMKKLAERHSAPNGQKLTGRVQPASRVAELQDCDFVIEAVFERLETKQEVLAAVSAELSPTAILASNTTTFPISELAKSVRRPENFIGTHFFAPVEQMELLEIILGQETSDKARKLALGLASRLGKIPLVVRDGPGFYTSRVVMAYIQEALLMLAEGISPSLIDNAARNAGMILGPLTMADLTSLDLLSDIYRNLAHHSRGSAEFASDALGILSKFVDAKRLGKKTRAGIYDYTEDGARREWEDLPGWFPRDPHPPTSLAIADRLMVIQTIETLYTLREGIIDAPELADLASVLGWKYPAFRGGVMRHVHVLGPEKFEAMRQDLETKYGRRFAIPPSGSGRYPV